MCYEMRDDPPGVGYEYFILLTLHSTPVVVRTVLHSVRDVCAVEGSHASVLHEQLGFAVTGSQGVLHSPMLSW